MKVAVVIPCYKVEEHIRDVVSGIPANVDMIITVNDKSPDGTASVLSEIEKTDSRVVVVNNDKNMGVGGAMITGFKEAVARNADVVIKLDGDGQMDPSYIGKMVEHLSSDKYDFVKGNRFFDRKMLKNMPFIRRFGNLGMSFLIKISSGYWNISDPTNGYFATTSNILKRIDYKRISKRFFFESSLIIEIYYAGARIKDLSMPAIYADEKSNLSIAKTLFTFPPKLFYAMLRRIWLRYFIYDFNMNSLYIIFGLPLFLFGLIFGIVEWIIYASNSVTAPTGTIMLAVIPLILGFQMLLAAVQYDMTAKNPFEIEK
jgi:glycosyltransferase involved in cell wall biosynthesis